MTAKREASEFTLYYQPQIEEKTRLAGAEALIRWHRLHRAMVPPAVFIPLAEDTGFIMSLGCRLPETACMQLVAWSMQPETAALTMAVNVSARRFLHPDFVRQVISVLEKPGPILSD